MPKSNDKRNLVCFVNKLTESRAITKRDLRIALNNKVYNQQEKLFLICNKLNILELNRISIYCATEQLSLSEAISNPGLINHKNHPLNIDYNGRFVQFWISLPTKRKYGGRFLKTKFPKKVQNFGESAGFSPILLKLNEKSLF